MGRGGGISKRQERIHLAGLPEIRLEKQYRAVSEDWGGTVQSMPVILK